MKDCERIFFWWSFRLRWHPCWHALSDVVRPNVTASEEGYVAPGVKALVVADAANGETKTLDVHSAPVRCVYVHWQAAVPNLRAHTACVCVCVCVRVGTK